MLGERDQEGRRMRSTDMQSAGRSWFVRSFSRIVNRGVGCLLRL